MPRIKAKCKICRRYGERMLMKGERCLGAKCGAIRRGTRPGMHGKARRRAPSEFSSQLQEKQKVRYSYGLTNTGLAKVFAEAVRMPGRTSGTLMQLLERRLDNVIYRAGFAVSRGIARNIVSHGHFLVNGRRVTIPSYRVRAGEVISIRESSKDSPMFAELLERLKKFEPPAWIELKPAEMKAVIRALPKEDELRSERNLRLVVEFYSK
ncbi:MAG: 30S ribosomal protein S4 [Candidatus Sungbacteria bacterium RIFCSPHIGHO2_02_FULL_49_20]|uniref:Small ribosomal subunit protein uS4 n=1 Tax=Candidatus Sungbacteria bacterium RIFCSPHIGHO2_02_FULL_49_20 TaxID=1802272 RepID=A0A1G2KRI0_9BACT|nr:MAG: 30S ribosomal protein S4 [Candidatus Sungbacteria bacterium RIFCSPHIGHO2_02_FULL_49_20]